LPRKTDSHNPADWLLIAASDLEMVRLAAENEISFGGARSKLAEILEKILKAELLRLGWTLEKTHDLNPHISQVLDGAPVCDRLYGLPALKAGNRPALHTVANSSGV
jgi:hypothetical protein